MTAQVTLAPPREIAQLDLFLDGRDAFLVHEVVTSLLARDAARATRAIARLGDEHPRHPDLLALTLLADALPKWSSSPRAPAALMARVEAVERELAPAARRLLGTGAASFLAPVWRALAEAAAGLPFDDANPRAHAGWLFRQSDDWADVRRAVEAEPAWAARPVLRHWLGLARHHLGEREAAMRLWLPLCWIDPPFFAREVVTLPDAILRDGWDAFEETAPVDDFLGDVPHAAAWFPAWLLVRHRGLARLFHAQDVSDGGPAARVFSALLILVPLEGQGLSDEVIAQRRALRQLSPEFFRYYMDVLGGRRAGSR